MSFKEFSTINKTILLVFFVLLKFALQIIAIDSGYELQRDEYLHLDLGRHLAWGYASVPPVTAWISFLIIQMGNTVFWVKFFPALFGALTIVVVWKTIEELEGNLFALVLGSVCILFSALLRINTLYQPNSLEFLLWTLMFYLLIKYINTENNKWLYLVALTFASGFMNKYNISFLLLGLLPAILITKHRIIFLNKHLYLALLLAFILIAPNLVWQYRNDFPVFHHLQTLADTQLVNVNRVDFLKEQLMFFFGSLFVIIIAFISFFRYAPFKKFTIFFWTYIFVISIYWYLKAKSYYTIGLYPVLIAFGAVYIEKLMDTGWVRKLRFLLILIPIITMIPIFRIMLPVMPPEKIVENSGLFRQFNLLRWEDGKNHAIPQDFADMLGWKELGALVDQAFDSIDNKENTLIHCDNYGQAGAINFYAKQIYTEAVTLNADYINWYPFDEMEINNVILVQHHSDTDKERERERSLFKKVIFIGEIENEFAREKGATVHLLKGAKVDIEKILQEEIQVRKSKSKK